MRRAALLSLAVISMPVFAAGCVQQDRYDSLLTANRSLQEQNVQLAEQRDAARANLDVAQTELAQARGNLRSLENKNSNMNTELEGMGDDYNRLVEQIRDLDFGPLPPDVELALEDLAASYPDILTFDARRGMLGFASDLTFALGSAQLQAEAAATINTVADIFNKEQARSFEVRVVGHTDNVPIGKPETRQKHPTNVHLSVHRAIAVRSALVSSGVDPVRIQVAGYGEFRPLVANGRQGAAENRRVEIFLAPAPTETSARAPVRQVPAPAAKEVASETPMK